MNSEFTQQSLRVLLVAEGSGGHLIPAGEVARVLAAQDADVMLVYADRPQTAPLMQELLQEADHRLHISAVSVPRPLAWCPNQVWRGIQAVRVWRIIRRHLCAFRPDVVAGFGGWFCVPALLAARQAGIAVLVHEQNVRLGRANRFLLHRADQFALSFEATCRELNPAQRTKGRAGRVVTGLPIRRQIGTMTREDAARRLGLAAAAPTLLVLGGSQGSRAINHLLCQLVARLTETERTTWQIIHAAGMLGHAAVQQQYAAAGIRGLVVPHLLQMAEAYALADVVIARAGASTIAEAAHCRKPAIFIPYPYAGGHQRDNARLVEAVGGGLWFDEEGLTAERLLRAVRRILSDGRVRHRMTQQIHTLARPDATQRLSRAILNLATHHAKR